MHPTFRQRVSRATVAGMIGATIMVGAQYLIGMPVGQQPDWLGKVASATLVPAQYILLPFSGVISRGLGPNAGNGVLLESTTPFGPAMRFEMSDLALVALATMIMVALADYLAQGVTQMWEERKQGRWPVLN